MDTGQEPSGVSVTPPEKTEVAIDAIINNVVGLIFKEMIDKGNLRRVLTFMEKIIWGDLLVYSVKMLNQN